MPVAAMPMTAPMTALDARSEMYYHQRSTY
jgi:hypothetical protein